MITKEIVQKFDKPGPRYTSYPTAPVWDSSVKAEEYSAKLREFGSTSKTLSLYVHIPFCASLCRFCACNVIIRRPDEKYGEEYLGYLFKEIDLLAQNIGKRVTVKQLHWGGGTPTFLTCAQIERLFAKIRENFDVDLDEEVAIEVDPRTINKEKLQTLKTVGFNRISFGVQDFDPKVQEAVNRIQSYAQVEQLHHWCRDLKFRSVNYDLIYGLPFQSVNSFKDTMKKVLTLRPDRVALYSFAYVPWLKKHQTTFSEVDLPTPDVKMEIFLSARKQFLDSGYEAIAMDHFALIDDELTKSFKNDRLYRNFMGYTVKPADEYIGLGVTSIGFLENTFVQNTKFIKEYYEMLDNGILPVERGIELKTDDLIRQYVIKELMCHFELNKETFSEKFGTDFDGYFSDERGHVDQCVSDGLITDSDTSINVTEMGKVFIRNVCMGFDHYLKSNSKQRYSKTV